MATWISSQLARIELPTPFEVGNVNVYVVEHRGTYFMVDCGPDTQQAWESLNQQLEELELTWKQIEFLVLTHHHADHAGQAWRIRDLDIPLYGHEKLVRYLEQTPNFLARGNEFLRDMGKMFGVPESLIARFPDYSEALRWIGPTSLSGTLEDGQNVTEDGAWRVIYLPGHASDQIGLLGPNGLLIVGDHLLEQMEPNPLIEQPYEGEGFASPVVQYIDSLRKLADYPVKMTVGGHGGPVHEVALLVEERIRQRYERSDQLLERWERDTYTVLDWSLELYGRKMRRAMPLVFSEVLARLTLLEERGQIVKTIREGVWYYRKSEEQG